MRDLLFDWPVVRRFRLINLLEHSVVRAGLLFPVVDSMRAGVQRERLLLLRDDLLLLLPLFNLPYGRRLRLLGRVSFFL